MKCNKIKIRSVYLSVIKCNIIKYKHKCQWTVLHPSAREKKRALYLCRQK